MRFPTWVKFLAVFMLASFSWVALSENFVHHHHTETEEHDCAYCQFHKTVSNADISTAPINIIPLFLVLFIAFVFSTTKFTFIEVEYPGRAPPVVL
jgi:ABC-type uncharacterized transport system permease subunit